MLDFLRRVTSVKLTPAGRRPKPKPQDETEYLLSSEANKQALLDAIERTRNGHCIERDLIEP